MGKFIAAIRQRLLTIGVCLAVIAIIFGFVLYNRTNQAHLEAALSGSSQEVRDRAVRRLVSSGRLMDVLANTQNPNEDAQSVQNQQSLVIRENAAEAVSRLSAQAQLPVDAAINTMFLLCKDSNSNVKSTAEDALATLGGQNKKNLNAIVDRLKDGDPDIRNAAADVLSSSKIDPVKAAQITDSMIKDPSAQDAAESALSKIGAPAVPLLEKHLSDPDLAFQQKIIDMLGKIAAPEAVPELVQAASSGPPPVRRMALVALANTVIAVDNAAKKAAGDAAKAVGDPKAKPEDVKKAQDAAAKTTGVFAAVRPAEDILVGAVKNPQDDSEARSQAALALGRFADPAAIAALVSALGDYDFRVAQASLAGVQSAGPEAVGPLTTALRQGQEETRAAAAAALGGIGNAPALAALNAVFADPATPSAVRRSAVVGLGRSGSLGVVPTLVSALGDNDGVVASAASEALLTPSYEQSAIPLLVSSLSKPTPAPFEASQTLSRMGSLAVPALEKAARTGSPQMQAWAAVTLGQTDSKDPRIVQALTPLAQSPDPHVQWAASQALERLQGT